jgi:hypothetical protein
LLTILNAVRRHIPITQLVVGGVNADWAEGTDEPAKLVWQERDAAPVR